MKHLERWVLVILLGSFSLFAITAKTAEPNNHPTVPVKTPTETSTDSPAPDTSDILRYGAYGSL